LGDGKAMPAPGYRKKLLTRFTDNPLSVDGYNARLLGLGLKLLQRKSVQHMVVIGHPKALTRYSIRMLESFIESEKKKHQFTTYTDVFRK
jgi:hypothetical protein